MFCCFDRNLDNHSIFDLWWRIDAQNLNFAISREISRCWKFLHFCGVWCGVLPKYVTKVHHVMFHAFFSSSIITFQHLGILAFALAHYISIFITDVPPQIWSFLQTDGENSRISRIFLNNSDVDLRKLVFLWSKWADNV